MADEKQAEAPLAQVAGNAPLSKTFAGYDPDEVLSTAYQDLSTALAARKKPQPLFDPTMLAMAQGFLAPTPTGSFGESLGAVSKNIGEVERQQQKEYEEEQKRIQENAMMRLSIGRDMKTARTESNIENQISNLYMQDDKGKYVLNPVAARNLATLTKDPKYAQMLIDDQRKKAVKAVADKMFVVDPETNKYEFNPEAVYQLTSLSENPIEDLGKYAKLIPEMRKAGLIAGLQDEATPFDVMALMASNPAIKAQAQSLAKKYAKGLIDPDKADSMAKDLLQMSMSHLDKEQQRDMVRAQYAVTNLLAQQGVQLRRERFEEANKANEGKLNDQQKIQYKNIVVPVVNEGIKAGNALSEIQTLKAYIDKAPSGLPSGVIAGTYGRVLNTDENKAMREIEASTKRLIPLTPRLPGSASNFDSQNIIEGLGKLNDPFLDNKTRKSIVDSVEKSFINQQKRAQSVEDQWEIDKTIPRELLGGTPSGTPAPASKSSGPRSVLRSGTIQSGPNAGKRVVEYSDGTREIK
jgi:hypothetical protein